MTVEVGQSPTSSLREDLNRLGLEGWELCALNRDRYAVLKRALPPTYEFLQPLATHPHPEVD